MGGIFRHTQRTIEGCEIIVLVGTENLKFVHFLDAYVENYCACLLQDSLVSKHPWTQSNASQQATQIRAQLPSMVTNPWGLQSLRSFLSVCLSVAFLEMTIQEAQWDPPRVRFIVALCKDSLPAVNDRTQIFFCELRLWCKFKPAKPMAT